MKIHPHESLLREAVSRPTKMSERVLEHTEQCQMCRTRLAFLTTTAPFRRSCEKINYGPSLERAYRLFELRQAALGRERSEAPRLLAHLKGMPPGRQQLLLRNSHRFQTWGLFELLLQYGAEETFVDPAHAEEILQLALEVSVHLSSSFYGKERIVDMRARIWGFIGNARRVRMDLQHSEEAFEEAFMLLRIGTDDVMERAVLFDLQASLRRAQRRLDEAVRLSSKAVAIYSQVRAKRQLAKVFVTLSTIYYVQGNIEKALAVLYQSFDLLSSLHEPRLSLCAWHNLSYCLSAAGRLMEAKRALVVARPLYQSFLEPWTQSRLKWLKGRIACGFGHYCEAKSLLGEARAGFTGVGADFLSNLVSRDLASLAPGPW